MQHDNLWAPWRMTYLAQLDSGASESAPAPRVCFLCEAAACTTGGDEARNRHVLISNRRGQILLNRYPYTNGHLLVAPGEHVPDLTDLTAEARGDLMELVQLAERILYAALSPQGINIGINIGRSAGAGIPGHLLNGFGLGYGWVAAI